MTEIHVYCGATPAGASWPVCFLEDGHAGPHESADYSWADGAQDAHLKITAGE